MLDFIRFERLALGLDQGHRQLLAEQVLSTTLGAVVTGRSTHSLLTELALPESELFDLIHGTRRLKMAVRGWVAEVHLERLLRDVPGVQECERLEGEGLPDISLRFKGSPPVLIECKNVLRAKAADGTPRVDFQKTRASKEDPCSRYYRATDFKVLAACLHAVTEQWEYRFIPTAVLPEHSSCSGRIASNLRVESNWQKDVARVLENVTTSYD